MVRIITTFASIIIFLGWPGNINVYAADPIVTQSTTNSKVTTEGNQKTTVKSPPPSAISPAITSSGSDLCTVGISGAVQTQILGISGGSTVRDMNCERLKLSKTLYDMGMKVAAVSTLCQDFRIFSAMQMAGTPCPFKGKIGDAATQLWDEHPELHPEDLTEGKNDNDLIKGAIGGFGLAGLLLFLL
jgi:hypothetical protein